MKDFPIQLTPKRMLLGGGLSLVFIIMAAGHVTSGQWTLMHGVLFGLVAIVVSWSLALTTRRDAQAKAASRRRFRNHMLLLIVVVLVMLAVFHVLDTFLVSYQNLIP
ncbi:MAG TPA: hypothetical protein VF745_02635 [Steroidobacteraceae bacterium]